MDELFRKELPAESNPSMRDVFDFCKRHNVDSLAQGMIELPPPETLRKLGGSLMVRKLMFFSRFAFSFSS